MSLPLSLMAKKSATSAVGRRELDHMGMIFDRFSIEPLHENALDHPIGRRMEMQGPFAGSLQPIGSDFGFESDHTLSCTKAIDNRVIE